MANDQGSVKKYFPEDVNTALNTIPTVTIMETNQLHIYATAAVILEMLGNKINIISREEQHEGSGEGQVPDVGLNSISAERKLNKAGRKEARGRGGVDTGGQLKISGTATTEKEQHGL